VPDDAILTNTDLSSSTSSALAPATHGSTATALLSFPAISRFVIPRQSLCANLLTLNTPSLQPNSPPLLLLSYPLCLRSPTYERNEFIFNFSLLLAEPAEIDVPSYKSILLKLSHLMLSLEEQSQYLSSDNSESNSGPIYCIIETLMSDLNNYCECMIPIDGSNTLHLKLFPTLPSPPPVKAWHVPLFTVRISALLDENWDLTMLRIIPYINGVNSIARIAALADADLKLTRKCIKHLLYYSCILLLDIFSFNNIYAPTAEFTSLIATSPAMQRECARYVNIRGARTSDEEAVVDGSFSKPKPETSSDLKDHALENDEETWPLTSRGDVVDGVGIVQLFAAMRQGLSVREWYAQNAEMLASIDLRRFVTFGVIKGFLYRVHRYAFRTPGRASRSFSAGDRLADLPSRLSGSSRNGIADYRGTRTGSRLATRTVTEENDGAEAEGEETAFRQRLLPYLDGAHCFDQICTEVQISEKRLTDFLKGGACGDVDIFCR
jgi:nitrogen permease regulator 2-like protein